MAKAKIDFDIDEFLIVQALRQEAYSKVSLDINIKILALLDKKNEEDLSRVAYRQVDDAIDDLISLHQGRSKDAETV